MYDWQKINQKRLLNTNIQLDKGNFCCIALTNPTEFVICSSNNNNSQAYVSDGKLWIQIR
jgi:hypothetical protein